MSYVYFIGVEGAGPKLVKIGYTKGNPFSRCSSLQTGCPWPLTVLSYFEGTMDDEQRLHRTFAPLRVNREWFLNSLKLADFIGYLTGDKPGHGYMAGADCVDAAIFDCILAQGSSHPSIPEEDYMQSAVMNEWSSFMETVH